MADFLSKLKSNIGEHAEDTSYTSQHHCFAEGGAVGNPSRLKGDGSLRQHGDSNVSLKSLKNIWSTSGEVSRFAKGGKVTCIEIDGGTMCAPDDGAIEIDGGFMIPVDDGDTKTSRTKAQAKKLANMGRDGDTELVHVNKDEEKLLKAYGGRGSINPKTGLREYPPLDSARVRYENPKFATFSWDSKLSPYERSLTVRKFPGDGISLSGDAGEGRRNRAHQLEGVFQQPYIEFPGEPRKMD